MCLAVPGKVQKIDNTNTSPRMAEVNFDGLIKQVCVEFINDIKVGEYVMVHVGYALNKVDEKEALNQLKAISEAEEIIRKNMK
ncbi:MAG: HypC/HybG/HupF family hydrogenase formation chaperone [Ignavibacteriaceae bacterium]|nr:HypC/HybG/HupF family hydrogenase formation chaperone [Ignavibacteriaceae bacterium]